MCLIVKRMGFIVKAMGLIVNDMCFIVNRRRGATSLIRCSK